MEEDYSEKACMKRALLRLNMGDMTSLGMYKYLTERRPNREPFPEETAKKVVKKLMNQDFINDKRFLSFFLERLDERCIGPRKIREELVKRNFSSRYITLAMQRDIDYKETASKLLEKKKADLLSDSSRENISKLVKFLVYNGFDYQTAYWAVENAIKNTEQED